MSGDRVNHSEMVVRHLKNVGRGYWVGLRLPENRDPDDFTMEEVTQRYFVKRALEAAIANGTAWLSCSKETSHG